MTFQAEGIAYTKAVGEEEGPHDPSTGRAGKVTGKAEAGCMLRSGLMLSYFLFYSALCTVLMVTELGSLPGWNLPGP